MKILSPIRQTSSLSASQKRRNILINGSYIMTILLNMIIVVVLLSAKIISLALINLSLALLFGVAFILNYRKPHTVFQIFYVWAIPIVALVIQHFYAQNINIYLYLFPIIALIIFLFKKKRLIYTGILWNLLVLFVIVFNLKYQLFPPLSIAPLVWVDFFWWFNIIGSMTVTILFVGIFRTETFNYEHKMMQQNDLLVEQKKEINQNFEELQANQEILEKTQTELLHKNGQIQKLYEDLSASIKYAMRIQQVILPPPEKIKALCLDAFVLFQPRDMVSGDFFYLEKVQEKIIITAIDCTGHGVPGAFMSLIGNDLLTEIIRSQQITQPAEILSQLHIRVHQLLRQPETNTADGMDMALVVVDKPNQKMAFAGAKNPLIYIQNGKLHQIKGDKMPIGGQQREKERIFTAHQIDISQPTTFYLYSDGYQDQFGGEKGKKFMTKRFRNLLFEIHQESMLEQKTILEETMTDWMGNQKQIDDILVIGVKV